MRGVFLLFVFLFSSVAFGQGLSEEDPKLYNLIMEYRANRGLEVVPLVMR